MNELLHLLRWDALLLHRNKLFLIAAVVTALYMGLFFLLKPIADLTVLLIVLIFNDPVVTGYLFAGVIWLFDRNQHTLQAISVLPLRLRTYLLSKVLLLSGLATVLSVVMAVATRGTDFQVAHLLLSVFLSAFLFSALGFAIGALSGTFNRFLLYSIPFFILMAVPFLGLFGIAPPLYFLPFPTLSSLLLLQEAFEPDLGLLQTLLLYSHLLFWVLLSWGLALKLTTRRLV